MEHDKPQGGQQPRKRRPVDDPQPEEANIGQEPRGVERGIADADKKARTGKTDEPIRNTPPAGAWNDTSSD